MISWILSVASVTERFSSEPSVISRPRTEDVGQDGLRVRDAELARQASLDLLARASGHGHLRGEEANPLRRGAPVVVPRARRALRPADEVGSGVRLPLR